MKATFQERVKELVDVGAFNLWNTVMVCYKLVMKYVARRKMGGTLGIHDGGMQRRRKKYNKRKWHIKRSAKIDWKKIKARYKNIKNRTKKVVANSMRKEVEKELTKLNEKPINILHW